MNVVICLCTKKEQYVHELDNDCFPVTMVSPYLRMPFMHSCFTHSQVPSPAPVLLAQTFTDLLDRCHSVDLDQRNRRNVVGSRRHSGIPSISSGGDVDRRSSTEIDQSDRGQIIACRSRAENFAWQGDQRNRRQICRRLRGSGSVGERAIRCGEWRSRNGDSKSSGGCHGDGMRAVMPGSSCPNFITGAKVGNVALGMSD
jgi:hypothetical protein